MKKNLKRGMIVLSVIMMCASLEAFATAVPKKTEQGSTQEKYSGDTQKVIETITSNTDKEEAESKNSEKETKTSSKSDEESETKTTSKPTETAKATATPKASAKATQKAKATEKATEKSSTKSTVSTVKPMIEDEEITTEDNEEEDNVIVVSEESPEPTLNVVNNPEQINGKRYLTKGGAFGMFILTVLVSAVLSFLISYRFYKMNRTDSHVMAEIRALKRDIDSKMSGTIGGFSEYETKTTNNNPNYSRNGEGVRRPLRESEDNTQNDMYSKWERQINTSQASKNEEYPGARRRDNSQIRQRTHARTQKSASSKLKGVIDDLFSKRK